MRGQLSHILKRGALRAHRSDFKQAGYTRCLATGSDFGEQSEFILEEEEEGSWTEKEPLTEAEKKSLIQQMIRANILSEVAASRLMKGQRCTDRKRPDYAYRQERGMELLQKAEGLSGEHRARPSLLRPLASAAGFSLGAISSILPKQAADAISGGMQEALTEQYNDQLRELRAAGLSDESSDLREVVRELRDEERAPSGAVQAPDLMRMQRPQELSSEEMLAGIVKYGMKGLLSLGSRV